MICQAQAFNTRDWQGRSHRRTTVSVRHQYRSSQKHKGLDLPRKDLLCTKAAGKPAPDCMSMWKSIALPVAALLVIACALRSHCVRRPWLSGSMFHVPSGGGFCEGVALAAKVERETREWSGQAGPPQTQSASQVVAERRVAAHDICVVKR